MAPLGDRSIVITRDCFEPAAAFLFFGSPEVGHEGIAGGTSSAGAVDGFFTGFDIERSFVRSTRPLGPHHRRPTSATKPAGQDLSARLAPKRSQYRSVQPENQSFLGNVVLSLPTFEHGMID